VSTTEHAVTEAEEARAEDPPERGVTQIELFFDLVFVFALTQVTVFIADDPTWRGMGRGLLVLAAVWWSWVGYAWLTNAFDPDHSGTRLLVFAGMAAMLLAAIAVPGAFGDEALLFGIAYFLVRLVWFVIYIRGASAGGEAAMRRSILQIAPGFLVATGLIIAAALVDEPLRSVLWIVALVIDWGTPAVLGVAGWRVSPGHFAERHGLIIIIALGESIVALGAGTEGIGIDGGVILAAVLGLAVSATLWWAYFDVVGVVAERKLKEVTGVARNRMARDSYSYLHLPMIAGIVLLALGLKKLLAHPADPLKLVPAVALCGGVAVYLLAHVAFRLRNMRTISPRRIVAAAAALALIPVATEVGGLVALGALTLVCVALIAFERIRYREARARLRAAAH
jgi:low temperature requirement protein LtrA